MEHLSASCNAAATYPRNLVRPNTYEYDLIGYTKRLDERQDSLFCNENKAVLDFWECHDGGKSTLSNKGLHQRDNLYLYKHGSRLSIYMFTQQH